MKPTAKALLLLALLLPAIAFAGPPLQGFWQTTDLGGPVPLGRYTEGWTAGGGALLAGTTFNAASWDGVSLGSSWRYTCAVEGADGVLISDTVNGMGFGTRTWLKTFSGGTVWLSGTGPWANGEPQYTGTILSYVEYETVTYVAGSPIAATTNVSATATIDGYDEVCLGFTVGNGAKIGDTSGGTPPANYPALLASDCSPTAPYGAWWNFAQMTLYIDSCTVSAENASWGAVKSLYR